VTGQLTVQVRHVKQAHISAVSGLSAKVEINSESDPVKSIGSIRLSPDQKNLYQPLHNNYNIAAMQSISFFIMPRDENIVSTNPGDIVGADGEDLLALSLKL